MKQESCEKLRAICLDSSLELFAYYKVAMREREGGGGGRASLAAAIGFTGSGLRGALILTIDSALVEASCPLRGSDGVLGLELMADWAGELANQLLGRVKIRLMRYGPVIKLSTPVVFSGQGLQHFPEKPQVGLKLGFESEVGSAQVEFQAQADDGFELSEEEPTASEMREGEISLF